MADNERSLLVLGLGNLLCADDGLGVHAVASLLRRFEVPTNARVLDGGTLGMSLLGCFEGADDVVLVDAIAGDGPAGTLVRLEDDDVAPAVRTRLSCHQIGVADLLDALLLIGGYPDRVVFWGMVPESLELDTNLSPAVATNLPTLVDRVVEEAARLGFDFRARTTVVADGSSLTYDRCFGPAPVRV